jgi:hypothetical protein
MTAVAQSTELMGEALRRSPELPDPQPSVGFLRLAACQHCGTRRRALVEQEGHLVGRCLACGEVVEAPLETVRETVFLVGRAGQRIVEVGAVVAA